MRMLSFARRCTKEILRDPLTMAFGLGFPVVLLLLLSAIQANIPVSIFEIDSLAPGITVFGLSFMSLFSAQLIARDRESAFLQRLYATPMSSVDFILGYTLPLLPLALGQCLICYLTGLLLGLELRLSIIWACLAILPAALFFISLGLLCGSVMNTRQVGGLCGALLTNLTAWFSGIWFDLELVGGFFVTLGRLLPFSHAVELERLVYAGSTEGLAGHLLWICAYAAAVLIISVLAFLGQMRKT